MAELTLWKEFSEIIKGKIKPQLINCGYDIRSVPNFVKFDLEDLKNLPFDESYITFGRNAGCHQCLIERSCDKENPCPYNELGLFAQKRSKNKRIHILFEAVLFNGNNKNGTWRGLRVSFAFFLNTNVVKILYSEPSESSDTGLREGDTICLHRLSKSLTKEQALATTMLALFIHTTSMIKNSKKQINYYIAEDKDTIKTGNLNTFKTLQKEKVIYIKPLEIVNITGEKTHQSHKSPTPHIRRGHYRIYKKTNKKVWVNSCKVLNGDTSNIYKVID